ncbi:Uncharacterised protein [Mycobacteroides abscessus subsp. massiliense]|nr:Uncharacterised protein [Mycobacteroides abscessus subsp. massiliense]
MKVAVGAWWTMDKRGQGIAHRVGAVLPDLSSPTEQTFVQYDHSWWIPLCACGPRINEARDKPRLESATLFSSYRPEPSA